jgi:hypothetical protein
MLMGHDLPPNTEYCPFPFDDRFTLPLVIAVPTKCCQLCGTRYACTEHSTCPKCAAERAKWADCERQQKLYRLKVYALGLGLIAGSLWAGFVSALSSYHP